MILCDLAILLVWPLCFPRPSSSGRSLAEISCLLDRSYRLRRDGAHAGTGSPQAGAGPATGAGARRRIHAKTGAGPETAAGPSASSRAKPAADHRPSVAAHGPPAPPAPPPEQLPVGPLLDKLGASLKQIEASLERHDLTDAELQALRQQIDPISAAVADALDRLTPVSPGSRRASTSLARNRTIRRRPKARL